ncbi:putative RNA polymerase sigma-70 factor, ECF subfamily [Candidatus Kuenenia stuttgartiensis]|uniref:Putative RNA polymerase sigma-70 factor, ECF subfamily n=1 Tax=Kuenenia stuttgartiensis TaxID=174633 RepID=A0A6G7GWZ3_KUEST|nr:sigma-70 family RNA polymerase sigma factor [Candidatus Kuenenia stuttgartiensis]QII13789.1 putative RNA polymerase sigma-70 factor, ECF subfamily [Candidatus Kuenenia stuttgartiensis]
MNQKDFLLIHIDALYRSALYLVKNEHNAYDLVQEAYLKAFKSLRNGKIVNNERAWLFKILMNTFINQYRKSKTEPSLVDFDSIESFHESIKEEVLTPSNTENEATFDELLDSDVKKALEELPDDFRLVVLLSIVEGFSYKEISKMLNCPIGTVMSRIYRGRKFLKEKLTGYAKKHGYERG